MLNVLPGRLQTNRVVPLEAQRCRVDFDYYYPADADPAARAGDLSFADEVQAEDIAICEAVQRGLASGSYVAGRLNPTRETGVWHFHELLRAAYATAPLGGTRAMSRLTLIVARARNGVIGKDNAMPWKIPGEQAYFKRVTMGHPIVMGRKTWESIGRPLPGRRSIVVTRDRTYLAAGSRTRRKPRRSIGNSQRRAGVFVIGGAQLYAAALPRADRLLITEIDHDFDGDTTFPAPDPARWRETARDHHAATPERPFGVDYVEYTRRA